VACGCEGGAPRGRLPLGGIDRDHVAESHCAGEESSGEHASGGSQLPFMGELGERHAGMSGAGSTPDMRWDGMETHGVIMQQREERGRRERLTASDTASVARVSAAPAPVAPDLR
jgi:hypothetical protein